MIFRRIHEKKRIHQVVPIIQTVNIGKSGPELILITIEKEKLQDSSEVVQVSSMA